MSTLRTSYESCLQSLQHKYPHGLQDLRRVFETPARPYGPLQFVDSREFDFAVPLSFLHVWKSRSGNVNMTLHICSSCGVIGRIGTGSSEEAPFVFDAAHSKIPLTSGLCKLCDPAYPLQGSWQEHTPWDQAQHESFMTFGNKLATLPASDRSVALIESQGLPLHKGPGASKLHGKHISARSPPARVVQQSSPASRSRSRSSSRRPVPPASQQLPGPDGPASVPAPPWHATGPNGWPARSKGGKGKGKGKGAQGPALRPIPPPPSPSDRDRSPLPGPGDTFVAPPSDVDVA